MNFELLPLREENVKQFKADMQASFQQGVIEGFGEMKERILPESHIDHSLNTKGSVAYEAFIDGVSVGGAIVIIDEITQHNHLDFLYVKVGTQSKGVGQSIWKSIEKLHPQTKVWETFTPYFDKRNIHFYVNRCGFRIVEFFNKHHTFPVTPNESKPLEKLPEIEYFENMLRFEKVMD